MSTWQVEFLVSYLAVTCCGATALPLNPSFTHAEFTFHLEDGCAQLLLLERADGVTATWQQQQSALRAAEQLKVPTAHVHNLAQLTPCGDGQEGSRDDPPRPFATPSARVVVPRETTAMVLYTSGTTGTPKAPR